MAARSEPEGVLTQPPICEPLKAAVGDADAAPEVQAATKVAVTAKGSSAPTAGPPPPGSVCSCGSPLRRARPSIRNTPVPKSYAQTRARWMAVFPLMNPTACDTAYFGGIDIIMWTWSGIKCPSSIRLSFCSANLRNTSPRYRRNCTYGVFLRQARPGICARRSLDPKHLGASPRLSLRRHSQQGHAPSTLC